MIRILFAFLLVPLLFGCKTSPPGPAAEPARDTSPVHTADDITRTYSASLETVFQACKLAIEDIGADHPEPRVEMKDRSATITAVTRTRLYGLILMESDHQTGVILIIEDKSKQNPITKSVFDEFWTAVESHL
jgi:hypothetical protein